MNTSIDESLDMNKPLIVLVVILKRKETLVGLGFFLNWGSLCHKLSSYREKRQYAVCPPVYWGP
jgi:hypothetical protein